MNNTISKMNNTIPKDVYTVNVNCGNCGFSEVIIIVMGKSVRESKCSKCGCFELHKSLYQFGG